MLSIDGYLLGICLHRGNSTQIYRGIRQADGQAVVLKVLSGEQYSDQELLKLQNHCQATRDLDGLSIVPPAVLEPTGSGYVLVMPDGQSISLRDYSARFSITLSDWFVIALQLSAILHKLFINRIIHKDINPTNILIHPDSKQIQLNDFCIASRLIKETEEIRHPNVLEGTLAYIAPEQTGRMNKGIDYRTDFYALGVTLFELLAGQLPFQSQDPLELVHCHLAKLAPALWDLKPEIPELVGHIVAKLMAKNAEERYQSALGLQYDLQLAQAQFNQNRIIKPFELGTQDRNNCFLIPEKLYGREVEVQSLLTAFDRVACGGTELILVAGLSGIGKTAVINEVHKPILRQRGYFIKGKFDQFNRSIPLSAIVHALQDLMEQLLCESDAQLAQWKTQILVAVGGNGQVLIEVVPKLVTIIGKQPPVPELLGTEAQNRFNLTLQRFIAVFAAAEHPLVLFLDDLQWADSASLQLIELLVQQSYLLILGAYRDNEVSPVHPFILTVKEISAKASVSTLTLAPLSLEDTKCLVADMLGGSMETARPLAELIYRTTSGNPFFTAQVLKSLYEAGAIYFAREHRCWECDFAQIKALSLTSDVVEFMVGQLQKLPAETQQVLKLAACVGHQFDLLTLATVSKRAAADVAVALWTALQEGLVLPTSQTYKFFQNSKRSDLCISVNPTYRFLHDRVQQAAYALIPPEQQRAIHKQIGRMLVEDPPLDLEAHLFTIVNHLNIGAGLMIETSEYTELAEYNLLAGRKARSATAYTAALDYASQGISLLPKESWHQQFDLTRKLHELRIETTCLTGDFEQMACWADLALSHLSEPLDRIKIYEFQIQAQIAQKQPTVGIEIGLKALQSLGIDLPDQPSESDIQQSLAETMALLSSTDIAALADLPAMSDPISLAAMQMFNVLAPAAYMAGSKIFLLAILAETCTSIQKGNAPTSAITYTHFAIILCGFVNDIEAGYQFGKLSLEIADRFTDQAILAKVAMLTGALILPWKIHPRQTLDSLHLGYQNALESGDLPTSAFCLYYEAQSSYVLGLELSELDNKISSYDQQIRQIKQAAHVNWISLLHQVVLNLREPTVQPWLLTGAAANEHDLQSYYETKHDVLGLYGLHFHKMMLCYWFGQDALALSHAERAETYLGGVMAQVVVPLWYFYDALIRLRLFEPDSALDCLEKVAAHQAKMQNWAMHAPHNFQHKVDLISAERNRVLNDKSAAIDLYDQAIAGAKANGYLHEEALANELAAQFYLSWGKDKLAMHYLEATYECYERWGAVAKVIDLERRYPDLLMSNAQSSNSHSRQTHAASQRLSSTIGTANSTSEALDLATLLRASQAISGEIEFNKLLATLLEIVIANAGAQKGALLLQTTQSLEVVAIAESGQGPQVLAVPTPLHLSPEVATALVHQVKHSLEPLILDDARKERLAASDRYLIQHQPKSILCSPILHQGELLGILYLENNLTVGAFTHDRIEVLNVLCCQAAISLENARLFNLEQEKNQALQLSLEQLQQSELRFQNLFEKTSEAILLFSEGRFLNCNQACVDLFGARDKTQICDLSPDQIAPEFQPDRQRSFEKANQMVVKALASGSHQIEWVLQRLNQETFWAEVTLTPISFNGTQILHSIVRDVSARKNAEQKLEFTQFAVDHSADGIAWVRPDGSFTYGNEAFRQMLGYSAAEFCALHVWDIDDTPSVSQSAWPAQWQRLKDIGSALVESVHHSKAGNRYPVEVGLDYFEYEGEGYHFIKVRNISDRKQAEQNLLSTNQQLELTVQELQRATRLKDAFLATMSHELRTPLNAILGLSEALQEEIFGPVNERQNKSLMTIERSGQHLLSLINDILDVSKISAGKVDLNIEKVSVEQLFSSSLALLRQQAHDKKIALNLQVLPYSYHLAIDERRMRQVLINLLSNAVKFTPSGGSIILSYSQESALEIAVTDTGIGITSEDQPKLFKPFTQLDSSLNRQYEGTGLGLTLAKQIVELHGGTIRVESQLGQGSCFIVELPMTCMASAPERYSSNPLVSPAASDRIQSSTDRGALILLAEDNEANLSTFVSYLTAQGCRMLTAINGRQAVELAQRKNPDLILMDVQMPEMDGLEAIALIRQAPQLVEIPIIALTALAMDGDRERCLSAGATDYLSKPVKLRRLYQTIQHWLEQTKDF